MILVGDYVMNVPAMNNFEVINERKRLEITIGQAANLANEWITELDEKKFEEYFEFFLAFLLRKQKEKLNEFDKNVKRNITVEQWENASPQEKEYRQKLKRQDNREDYARRKAISDKKIDDEIIEANNE